VGRGEGDGGHVWLRREGEGNIRSFMRCYAGEAAEMLGFGCLHFACGSFFFVSTSMSGCLPFRPSWTLPSHVQLFSQNARLPTHATYK